MFRFITTNRFEKEYKLMQKRGKDMNKLDTVMLKLIHGETLDKRYKDHTLKGNFKDRRECHIEPDWLLVYKLSIQEKMIIFERTGSHADIFE